MAVSSKTRVSMGKGEHHNTEGQKTKSGEATSQRLYGDNNLSKTQDSLRPCPSLGMEILQRQDTAGIDNQPQKRNQERQQTRKSGSGNVFSKQKTRFQAGIDKSKRREKSGSETHRADSIGHTQVEGGREKSIGNSKDTQHQLSASLCNRKSNPMGISQIIIGAESINGRPGRECKISWVRDIVQQCKAAGVKLFVKQIYMWKFGDRLFQTEEEASFYHKLSYDSGNSPKLVLVRDIKDFPADLRIQERI